MLQQPAATRRTALPFARPRPVHVRPPAGGLHATPSCSWGIGVMWGWLTPWLARLRARWPTVARDTDAAVAPLVADPLEDGQMELASPVEAAPAVATVPATPASGQRPAFSGRGAYCYESAGLLTRYGSL